MQEFITKDSLLSLNINFDGQDIDSLLEHLNNTLQERVGTELVETLDDTKLQTLVEFQESASDEEIGTWLETNVPEFEQIVKDEIEIILGELVENGDGVSIA